MKFNQSQFGATLTEFIVVGPIIFILGMTGLQYTLVYNAKTNLTYAAYEAARSGAIENASPASIQKGLIKGLLPFLSANKGVNGEDPGKLAELFQNITTSEAPFMRVEILNPNQQAFDDFNNEYLQKLLKTDQKVIPNKHTDIDNLKNKLGLTSGVSIEEANVLKLRITYGYEPKIPLIKGLFAGAYDLLSGPHDSFNMMLFATNRIPIVVDVSSQMLSPAVQNGLEVPSIDPGNSNPTPIGGHQLPDLSQINLPKQYQGMSKDKVAEEILKNGKDNNINNNDWAALLLASGIVITDADQLSGLINGIDKNGNFDKNIVAAFNTGSGSNQCSGFTNDNDAIEVDPSDQNY